ncbi:MAG: hypothetical protein MN733_30230 [Nitrososphaera sp.]|nr:hypothetical protein [Nitrososphaera sp.]
MTKYFFFGPSEKEKKKEHIRKNLATNKERFLSKRSNRRRYNDSHPLMQTVLKLTEVLPFRYEYFALYSGLVFFIKRKRAEFVFLLSPRFFSQPKPLASFIAHELGHIFSSKEENLLKPNLGLIWNPESLAPFSDWEREDEEIALAVEGRIMDDYPERRAKVAKRTGISVERSKAIFENLTLDEIQKELMRKVDLLKSLSNKEV